MIRVLFITAKNPYVWEENRYAPLWPAYLASYAAAKLGKNAVAFTYVDHGLDEAIRRYRPQLVGISAITQNFGYAEDLARIAKSFGLPVVVGGMHITSMPQSLSGDMDIGCLGESEQTFADLLSVLLRDGKFSRDTLHDIPGIVYHGDNGPVRTEERPAFLSIDTIPHPDRDLVGYADRAYIYTTRGCPSRCVFCACSRYWGKVRFSSPEYLIEEIDDLVAHGATRIRFADENFVAHPKRLARIADLLVERGYHRKLKFSCWCRANFVTPEVVAELKRMHIVSVKLGLESGSDRVLKYLKGDVTVADNIRAIRMLKDAGFQVNGDFMFGVLDETPEEIEMTYRFIKTQPLDMVDINIFTPFPSTPVWDIAHEKGVVSDTMDWRKINIKFRDDPHQQIVLSDTLSYDELRHLHKRFEALRFRKTLRALPRSPWLDELPGVALRIIKGRIIRASRRFFA